MSAPPKNKRPRIDSVAGQVEVFNNSGKDLSPPPTVKLTKYEKAFFKSILAEFANYEWTDHKLEIAALLARAMCDMEKQQRILSKEGPIIKPKGKEKEKERPYVNPRKGIVEFHASMILSYRRTLSLQAAAKDGDARDIAKRRAAAKKLELEGNFNDEDDLIPRAPLN